MNVRDYYTDLVDRAVKTAAQSATLVLAAEQVNVVAVDWFEVAGFAAGGAVLSALTTLAQRGIFGRGE